MPRGVLLALILVIVLTQRLAVPVGSGQQIPASLPLAVLVVVVGLTRGALVVDHARARLYALSVGVLVALTVLSLLRSQNPSLLSIGFIVALYGFAALNAPELSASDVDWLLDCFVTVMLVAAGMGLAQMVLQYSGVPWQDWLAVVIPPHLLLDGYNTGDPIAWTSSFHRVNGVLFLEPSFFSYFLGLAAAIAVYRGRSMLAVTVLLLAIVPTLAGNGVVLLVVTSVAMAYGRRRRNLRVLVPPVAAAALLAWNTPIADRYLLRITEVGNDGSSSSLRFVQPYERLLQVWLPDPWGIAVGNGAGSATRLTGADQVGGLLVPIVPKLLIEYGIVGTALFLFFLLWSLLQGPGGGPWAVGLLVSYLVLNAALLQVTLALSTIVFIHLLRVGRTDVKTSAKALRDRPVDCTVSA